MGQLHNGLRYALRPCHDPAHALSIALHIDAGSLREADDQRGAARIAAGLAARGSGAFDPPALRLLFEQRGLSATTDLRTDVAHDRATVRINLPHTNEPPDLRPILAYLASLIDPNLGPIATPDEIARQRQQIIDADAATANASTRLATKALPVLLPGARITAHPPRDIEHIEHTTTEAINTFLRDHYTPSGAVLVITGDLAPEQLAPLIEDVFGPLRAGPIRTAPDAQLRAPAKPVVAIEQEPEFIKDAVQVLAFTEAQPPVRNQQDAGASLADRLAFAALTDRIAELTQSKESPIRAGAAFSVNDGATLRMSSILLMGEPDTWPALTEEAITELRRAIEHGFDEHLLASARASLRASLERSAIELVTSAPALADRLAEQIARRDTPISAAQEAEIAGRLLDTITNDQLKHAIAAQLDPARAGYLVVTSNPVASDHRTIERRMGAALKKTPPPTRSEPIPDHILSEPPAPGRITRLSIDAPAQVLTAQCDGGMRFHVRTLGAVPGRVAVALAVSGGKVNEDVHTRGLTSALVTLWARPSVAGHAPVQTERLLASLGIRVSGTITDDAVCIIAEAPAHQLPIALEFMRGVIDDPAPDRSAFADVRSIAATAAAARDLRPFGALDRLCAEALFPLDDPRHAPLSSEEVNQLSADRLTHWARWLFAHGTMEIAIVGDVDRARSAELAAAILGGVDRPITSPPQPTQLARPAGPIVAQAARTLATPQAAVAVGIRGPDHAMHRDVILADLAAVALTERLTRRLRDQENLAPIINVESRPADAYLGTGTLRAIATTDPAKASPLVERMRDELTTFAKEGPQSPELRAAKSRLAGLWREQLQDPRFWARELALTRLRAQPLDLLTDTLDLIDRATAADLIDLLQRYDTPDGRFTVVVQPARAQRELDQPAD